MPDESRLRRMIFRMVPESSATRTLTLMRFSVGMSGVGWWWDDRGLGRCGHSSQENKKGPPGADLNQVAIRWASACRSCTCGTRRVFPRGFGQSCCRSSSHEYLAQDLRHASIGSFFSRPSNKSWNRFARSPSRLDLKTCLLLSRTSMVSWSVPLDDLQLAFHQAQLGGLYDVLGGVQDGQGDAHVAQRLDEPLEDSRQEHAGRPRQRQFRRTAENSASWSSSAGSQLSMRVRAEATIRSNRPRATHCSTSGRSSSMSTGLGR